MRKVKSTLTFEITTPEFEYPESPNTNDDAELEYWEEMNDHMSNVADQIASLLVAAGYEPKWIDGEDFEEVIADHEQVDNPPTPIDHLRGYVQSWEDIEDEYNATDPTNRQDYLDDMEYSMIELTPIQLAELREFVTNLSDSDFNRVMEDLIEKVNHS
jgi:hypothetical protein